MCYTAEQLCCTIENEHQPCVEFLINNGERKKSAMSQSYYIASCVFTSKFPLLSKVIQQYIHDRYGMQIVCCCVPQYSLQNRCRRIIAVKRLPCRTVGGRKTEPGNRMQSENY